MVVFPGPWLGELLLELVDITMDGSTADIMCEVAMLCLELFE